MSAHPADPVLVPLSANTPPYRIDDPSPGGHYVRIRKAGPDVLVLVPPGDDASGFRDTLIAELRAHSVRGIDTRRYDWLLYGLLFVLVPLMLLTLLVCLSLNLVPSLAGSSLGTTAPAVVMALMLGYGALVLMPRVGLAHVLTSAQYPRDPEHALREISESGIRYLTEDDLDDGTASMDSLRHDVLTSPATVRAEEWAALWVLAARDELYGSALVTTRKLAQIRLEETIQDRAREFSAEMQVSLDDLESMLDPSPPTSPGENHEREAAA